MICAYCRQRDAVHRDHLITRSQARRSFTAAQQRENPKFKIPSCSTCNWRKGTRLRVPPDYAHLIPELEQLTGGKYAVWSGDAEGLSEVVK